MRVATLMTQDTIILQFSALVSLMSSSQGIQILFWDNLSLRVMSLKSPIKSQIASPTHSNIERYYKVMSKFYILLLCRVDFKEHTQYFSRYRQRVIWCTKLLHIDIIWTLPVKTNNIHRIS